mmetsp:Transcript_4260/g.11326  ORF Transcript_4260/g.11326 Transcript_4260/m.11326 type:complete len:300 (-) Transcript_4260:336-1235(-)
MEQAPVLHAEEQDRHCHEAPIKDWDGREERGDAAGVSAPVVTTLESCCPNGLRKPVPCAPDLRLHSLPNSLHGGLGVILLCRLLCLGDALLHSVGNGLLDLPDRDLLVSRHDYGASGDKDVAAVDGPEHVELRVGDGVVDVHVELQPHLAFEVLEDRGVVADVREGAVDVHVVGAALRAVRPVAAGAATGDDGDAGATWDVLGLYGADLVEGELATVDRAAVEARSIITRLDNHLLAVEHHRQVAGAHAEPAVALVHAVDDRAPEGHGSQVSVPALLAQAVEDAFCSLLQLAVVHIVGL